MTTEPVAGATAGGDEGAKQEASKGKGKGPPPVSKGKPPPGKGGPPPPGGGKGKGKQAEALPQFQLPRLDSDWQAEKVVHWQPIKKAALWNGSVWEKVNASLKSGAAAAAPPETLLRRFMHKRSEQAAKKAPGAEQGKSSSRQGKAGPKRLLSQKAALLADINHKFLLRKGIRRAEQLRWIVGPKFDASDPSPQEELPEDILEALLGFLDAASGEQAVLRQNVPPADDLAEAEKLLCGMLAQSCSTFEALQARTDLSLKLARLPARVSEVHEELHLVLSAACSVLDSTSVPMLLEGVLLLGNYVNARNGGAVIGVTLQSLGRLAHTRCLPAENGRRSKHGLNDNALIVLVRHLDGSNPGFAAALAADLDACYLARDFDPKVASEAVRTLQLLVKKVKSQVPSVEGTEEAEAVSKRRLDAFLETSVPMVDGLQELLEEIKDTTAALRQWFAEPQETTLTDMLRSLALLRDALPVPRSKAPQITQRRPEQSRRRSSLDQEALTREISGQKDAPADEKAAAAAAAVSATEADAGAAEAAVVDGTKTEEQLRSVKDGGAAEDVRELVVDPEVPPAAPAIVIDFPPPEQELAPSALVVQLLSLASGTLTISWLFDWDELPTKFPGAEWTARGYEVVQCGEGVEEAEDGGDAEDCESASLLARYPCSRSPLRVDVPPGRRYRFQVRALLLDERVQSPKRRAGDGLCRPPIWASQLSEPCWADLRGAESPSSTSTTSPTKEDSRFRQAVYAAKRSTGSFAASFDSYMRAVPEDSATQGYSPHDADGYSRIESLADDQHQQPMEELLEDLWTSSAEATPGGSESAMSGFEDHELLSLANALSFLEKRTASFSEATAPASAPSPLERRLWSWSEEGGGEAESDAFSVGGMGSQPASGTAPAPAVDIADDDSLRKMVEALSILDRSLSVGEMSDGSCVPEERVEVVAPVENHSMQENASSSPADAAAPACAGDGRCQIELDRSSGGTLGLGITLRYSDVLITSVQGGLAEAWNDAKTPSSPSRLRPGDSIVVVNGVSGNGSLLVKELKKEQLLTITIQHFEGPGHDSVAGVPTEPQPSLPAGSPPGPVPASTASTASPLRLPALPRSEALEAAPDHVLDGNEVLEAAARAYRASVPCSACQGTGQVLHAGGLLLVCLWSFVVFWCFLLCAF
eukprot:TRINITY_DN22050_c0_g3_i1.p1 TRINITY_DN22050_c0_g3~~TRINITY_DN22050_c0_g3_i1.p1  ORF type:complete len:1208 (-),score=322.82 TRINITY_DN22050_c0_g3_i1:45-3527(-)